MEEAPKDQEPEEKQAERLIYCWIALCRNNGGLTTGKNRTKVFTGSG